MNPSMMNHNMVFQWLVGLLIVFQRLIGFLMSNTEDSGPSSPHLPPQNSQQTQNTASSSSGPSGVSQQRQLGSPHQPQTPKTIFSTRGDLYGFLGVIGGFDALIWSYFGAVSFAVLAMVVLVASGGLLALNALISNEEKPPMGGINRVLLGVFFFCGFICIALLFLGAHISSLAIQLVVVGVLFILCILVAVCLHRY